ncbi:zinc finger protein 646-like [Belonocnema kinseyi]|uniref:zinc finger protein 646-like n=1 Tax=Belonocnema kinseyi TaxID=2817044 RepID=UPI00143D5704|nr:zinc finger protein 646-like [Belonocnema kinseyi]
MHFLRYNFLDPLNAKSNIKNFQRYLKKSTRSPKGGPYSTLQCGDFSEFEHLFSKRERKEHNLFSESNQFDSDAKSLAYRVEYENNESLEIKEEIVQDEESVADQEFDTRYDTKLYTADLRNAEMLTVIELRNQKKQQIQDLQPEMKYACEKCARSYKHKYSLTHHQKYECDIMPRFKCKICGQKFKRIYSLSRHQSRIHFKTN